MGMATYLTHLPTAIKGGCLRMPTVLRPKFLENFHPFHKATPLSFSRIPFQKKIPKNFSYIFQKGHHFLCIYINISFFFTIDLLKLK